MIDWLEHHLLSCPFKSLLGIDCPGCGMQRAFIALLRGNIAESLHLHAALIPTIVTFGLLIFQIIAKKPEGGRWVMWSFIATTAICLTQYGIKLYAQYH